MIINHVVPKQTRLSAICVLIKNAHIPFMTAALLLILRAPSILSPAITVPQSRDSVPNEEQGAAAGRDLPVYIRQKSSVCIEA